MTVLVFYKPVVQPVRQDGLYGFGWESVGKEAIEVFEIDNVKQTRAKVKQDRYVVEYFDGDPRVGGGFTRTAGRVRFTSPYTTGTTEVSVERNTLITQTVDWPAGNQLRFNGRMIEFALDKHTMIAQELVQRKCTAVTGTPITQEVVFSAYDTYDADVINFAVNKVNTILQEIKATAEPCNDRPEET